MMITLFFLIFFVVFLLLRKSKPAEAKEGSGLVDNELVLKNQPKDVITVATFNIQTGKSLTGKRDIARSANTVKDADLVGVQEVYAPTLLNRIGFGICQTHYLAKIGKFAWLLSATKKRWLIEHRGNGLLSKLPISDWRVEILPDQSKKSFRNMTVADVNWQGTPFTFINTHLHTRGGRSEQLTVVLNEFKKHPRVILVGDFNSRPSSQQLTQLLLDPTIVDTIGQTQIDTDEANRVDWILTKGFNVEEGRMVEKGVSDHPYYQVKLSLK